MSTSDNTATSRNIIDKLKSILLESTNYIGLDLLNESIDKLGKTLECTECSLWSINNNNHRQKKNQAPFISTSLLHRWINDKIRADVADTLTHREDFAHEINNVFLLNSFNNNSTEAEKSLHFLRCDREAALENYFQSREFLEKANLNDFIIIPIKSKIPNYYGGNEIVAILEFSFQEKKYENETLVVLSRILMPFFSSALHRYSMIHKQNMMVEIIERHCTNEEKGPYETFKSFIDLFMKRMCPSHAASFFMWDTYQYRYNLIYTSVPMERTEMNKVYYELGTGITGKVAKDKKALALDDVSEELKEHKAQWLEMDISKMKTVMTIPISRVSKKKEVVGILRFINKKNLENGSFIDYYNDRDIDIIQSASSYLALTIDCFIKEAEQKNFIDKLSHELMTPANSIRKSADRILKKKEDKEFINKYLYSYINDILNAADNQIWQVKTNLYQVKGSFNSPFETRKYKDQIIYLSDILQKSKEIVRPIARNHNVLFDNIMPEQLFIGKPLPLKVDKDAFVTVFYNLFTNAIKYHETDNHGSFLVLVSSKVVNDSIVIDVMDYGIGINEKERESLFLMGYRGINAIEEGIRGFGVGLTTVKQIIEDYAGTIEVTGLKNPTKFTIKLPLNLLSYE